MTTPDPAAAPLTNAEAATLAGLTPATWRNYVTRGYAPPPDGRIGTTPWWHQATITAWFKTRPGRGARTDLRKPVAEETAMPCPDCSHAAHGGDICRHEHEYEDNTFLCPCDHTDLHQPAAEETQP